MTLLGALFLFAPLVVVPLGLRLVETPARVFPARLVGVAGRWAIVAAVPLVPSFALPAGAEAGLLALPWLIVCGIGALGAAAALVDELPGLRPAARHAGYIAMGFLAVGAAFGAADRFGFRPFGFDTLIIRLTAIHFHFAGFLLPIAGAMAYRRRPAIAVEAAIGAVIVGIPLTAFGFFGFPLPSLVGSLLVAGGGFVIGIAHLVAATGQPGAAVRLLARVAGASLLLSMPLAATYALRAFAGTPAPDIEWMARVHGGLNVFGFALPAIAAWSLDRRGGMAPRIAT